MTDPIMEAAVRAMPSAWSEYDRQWVALDMLAAVTPLIRAQVLEEAAKEADDCVTGEDAAHNIRALKERP